MNCSQVQEWLIQNITVAGIEPTDDIQGHLDACDACRSYYEELLAFAESMSPLDEISLTADESEKIESGIMASIERGGRWNTYLRPEKRIYTLVRALAGIAALILIVLIVPGKQTTDEGEPIYSLDDLDLRYTSVEDLAPLFMNGERDYLPSLIDDEKAAYLTDQVYPVEAEGIFESATSEEIEWLMENYSMEI